MALRLFSRTRGLAPLFRQTAARSFATDEASPWDTLEKEGAAHNPLVQLYGTPAKYASAAYRQASQEGTLDQVEKDLETITGLLAGEESLANFIYDPTTPEADKLDALNTIGADYKFAEVTTGLLAVATEAGKLNQLDKITDAFSKYMSAKRGDVQSMVTSATPLSKKDEKAVRAALEARLQPGQQLVMQTAVDSSIIGGLVVEFGDELADLSVRSSMEDIGEALANPAD